MGRNYRIYKYTNILNGMKYVGSTCLTQYQRAGKGGRNYIKSCPVFGEAIVQDGWGNFKYEVIEDGLTKEEACEREKYWIEKDDCVWPNGYNLDSGRHYRMHPITLEKLSISHKGLDMTYCSKPVKRFSMDNEFLGEYPSIMEASRRTGVHFGGISRCCLGKRKSAGKYVWKFS